MSQGYDEIFQFLKQRSTLITQIAIPANTVFTFSLTSFYSLIVGVEDYSCTWLYSATHNTLYESPGRGIDPSQRPVKIKVKQSRYTPGVAQRVPGS